MRSNCRRALPPRACAAPAIPNCSEGGGVGRLRYLVYGPTNADTDCEECEGGGVLVCAECGHESQCEDCDGTGTIRNPTDYLDWTEVLDLNGQVVWKEDDDGGCPVGELQYTADWAAGVIAEYEAGREQAPAQHPIIPEAA